MIFFLFLENDIIIIIIIIKHLLLGAFPKFDQSSEQH